MQPTVSELAKHYGLAVRTLQHYDHIGLVKPSARSEVGISCMTVETLPGCIRFRHCSGLNCTQSG